MPLLANINVGSAPNDGTGDTIRNAFTIVNENFQFIEAFFPNTDVANLTANITSTGTSTFNTINSNAINAATIGNSGTAFVGTTVSAATIGNTGASISGSTVSAATIGNAGATLTGSTVNAATIGNLNASLIGTIYTNSQPYINTIGETNSNVSIQSNLIIPGTYVDYLKSIRYTVSVAAPYGGAVNLGMVTTNNQHAVFHMNSNITCTLVGNITSGLIKDLYFINSSGGTLYTTIFPYSDRTNKGTNVIAVANGTTTLVHVLSTDTTAANIVAIISNT